MTHNKGLEQRRYDPPEVNETDQVCEACGKGLTYGRDKLKWDLCRECWAEGKAEYDVGKED